jgi:hypothetical protein
MMIVAEPRQTFETPTSPAAPQASPAPAGEAEALTFRVARDLKEVIASWRVVYDVYVRSGFIHPNPYLIHTTPHVLSTSSAVFHSAIGDEVESTLTAMVDGPMGLPLDSVFRPELDAFRQRGRRLTEYGLFAHTRQLANPEMERRAEACKEARRESEARVQSSIVHLMRLAFYFALTRNSSDFVVGVHPKHARFYTRAFGFKQIGPVKTYATVNHRAVTLLHANLEQSLQLDPLPHALDYCLQNPVSVEAFEERCTFRPRDLASSPIRIDAYLRERMRRAG